MPEKTDVYDYLKLYLEDFSQEPFQSSEEQWQAWESFVNLLCVTSLVMKEQKQPERLERIGCLLEDEELVEALAPRIRTVFPYRKELREVFASLVRRGQMDEGTKEPLYLSLFLGMRLKPVEMSAFVFAACADRDRRYERAFGVLQEEKSRTAKPTAGLVHDLCALFLEEEENTAGILLDEDSFLNRFLLEPQKDDPRQSRLSRPITLRRQVLLLLLGNQEVLGPLAACGEILRRGDTDQMLCHSQALKRLIQVFTRMTVLREDGLICLHGVAGAGKKYLAQALGDTLGMEVLCIHGGRLLTESRETVMRMLEEAVLKTVLAQQVLYLDLNHLEPVQAEQLRWILVFLQNYVGRFLIGMNTLPTEEGKLSENLYLIPVNTPGAKDQKKFWKYFAQEYQILFAEDVDLDQLVSLYDLTPEKIRRTLVCAMLSSSMEEKGFRVTKQELEEEIRHQCSGGLDKYAARLESPFMWEDLQLSEESKKLLKNVCDRVRYRSVVNDTYGFGKKLPYGRGLSVVLYGPPGTGKTMAAQVLAKELGLDIYRIDLSQIGSKYIGETEKNLGAVFDAARFSNAILFFDEADALFTKRTDVANSNDRHANAETAYLLQKIEEYSGVSILATNVMQNFDNAFKRRMTFMIPIDQPGEEERLLLWQKVFPEEAPLDPGIDFRMFAKIAELTGSGIKSAALSAAYRAAAEQRKITNEDLIEAVDFEYRRTGRTGISQELYTAQYMKV